MNSPQNLVNLVQAFQDAANRHAVDTVMTMFADDAEFELVGWCALVGKQQIRTLGEIMQAFVPWIAKNYPTAYSKMFTPTGRFIYSRENGERVVPLMKEWRTSQGR